MTKTNDFIERLSSYGRFYVVPVTAETEHALSIWLRQHNYRFSIPILPGETLEQAMERQPSEPGVVQRICHALTDNCVMVTDPERQACTPENCAAMKAALKSDGDHGVPTDGQLMDQLEAAFEKMNDGYVEMDLALRHSLAENLVRFNRPKERSKSE